jgi:hypothetical protein
MSVCEAAQAFCYGEEKAEVEGYDTHSGGFEEFEWWQVDSCEVEI